MKIHIETERLIIRSFKNSDYKKVAEACNEPDLAKMTLGIPIPYTEQNAKDWIAKVKVNEKEGISYELAVCFKDKPNHVIGSVAIIDIKKRAQRGEIGYWINKNFWGQGIATEAAKAIINFGFNTLNLHSIIARHFEHNPASGRVMQKCGMRYAGMLREHESRFDTFFNVVYYDLLKSEFTY